MAVIHNDMGENQQAKKYYEHALSIQPETHKGLKTPYGFLVQFDTNDGNSKRTLQIIKPVAFARNSLYI